MFGKEGEKLIGMKPSVSLRLMISNTNASRCILLAFRNRNETVTRYLNQRLLLSNYCIIIFAKKKKLRLQ